MGSLKPPDALQVALHHLQQQVPAHSGLRCFHFGSSTQAGTAATDLDLLIVHPPQLSALAHHIATRLRELEVVPPVDVIVMNTDEALETDFVENEACRLVWPTSEAV